MLGKVFGMETTYSFEIGAILRWNSESIPAKGIEPHAVYEPAKYDIFLHGEFL